MDPLIGSRSPTFSEDDVNVTPAVDTGESFLPDQHRIGIFWDMENVRVPRGFRAAEVNRLIREKLKPLVKAEKIKIAERRLYYDARKSSEMRTDREAFDMSGFTLVDCPTGSVACTGLPSQE